MTTRKIPDTPKTLPNLEVFELDKLEYDGLFMKLFAQSLPFSIEFSNHVLLEILKSALKKGLNPLCVSNRPSGQ